MGTKTTNARALQLRSVIRNRLGICTTKVNISAVGRRRSPVGGTRTTIGFLNTARFRMRQRITPVAVILETKTRVESFLNAIAIPQPQGRLLLQSLSEVENPAQPSSPFGGTYLRGETIPLKFTVRGVRLQGLNATFTACKVGQVLSAHDITKTVPTIRQGAISNDSRSGVEEFSANFSIESSDTSALADGEHEYEWLLIVADGNGRQYRIDQGKFKIYSYC
jgi:hypothetical protein